MITSQPKRSKNHVFLSDCQFGKWLVKVTFKVLPRHEGTHLTKPERKYDNKLVSY